MLTLIVVCIVGWACYNVGITEGRLREINDRYYRNLLDEMNRFGQDLERQASEDRN